MTSDIINLKSITKYEIQIISTQTRESLDDRMLDKFNINSISVEGKEKIEFNEI